jgi:hypothetical protein
MALWRHHPSHTFRRCLLHTVVWLQISSSPSANSACPRLRLVYGLLSLRGSDDVQKPLRFRWAKFFRNHSRSDHNHVLGRLYCSIRPFAGVHNLEHGEGMFGDLVIVRISSHGAGSLRRVDNIVTGLRRYTNRQLLALSLTKKGTVTRGMLRRSLQF